MLIARRDGDDDDEEEATNHVVSVLVEFGLDRRALKGRADFFTLDEGLEVRGCRVEFGEFGEL